MANKKKLYKMDRKKPFYNYDTMSETTLEDNEIPSIYVRAYSKLQAKTYIRREIATILYLPIKDIDLYLEDIEELEN